MKKNLLWLIISLIVVGCSKPIIIDSYNNSGDDYYFYGNSVNRNFYHDVEISDSLQFEFTSNTKGGFSSVAFLITQGFYIAADNAGQIYTFVDTSGKQIGILKHKGEIAITPIIIKSHLIYAVNEYKENYSKVYFYNYITGIYAAEVEVSGNISNEMIFINDELLILTQNGTIHSFNSKGDLLWSFKSKHKSFCDPVIYQEDLVFSSVTGDIIIFDLKKQKIREIIPLSDSFESSPLIFNDVLYIGDYLGELIAYDLRNQQELWRIKLDNKILTEPVMDISGNIYCNTLSGFLYQIDSSTGIISWTHNSGGIFNTPALVFKNIILQSDLNKRLLFVDKRSGKYIKEINYDRRVQTAPMFHNGIIYLGIDRGTIYRYKAEIL